MKRNKVGALLVFLLSSANTANPGLEEATSHQLSRHRLTQPYPLGPYLGHEGLREGVEVRLVGAGYSETVGQEALSLVAVTAQPFLT